MCEVLGAFWNSWAVRFFSFNFCGLQRHRDHLQKVKILVMTFQSTHAPSSLCKLYKRCSLCSKCSRNSWYDQLQLFFSVR